MIKAITIDFWNTLFDNSNGLARNAYRQEKLIREIDNYGIAVKQDEFQEAMSASWGYFNNIWLNDQRTPLPKETAAFFWQFLKLPKDEGAIDRIAFEFGESILKHPPKLMPNVKSVLEELCKDYKLGVVSDTGFSPGVVLRELMKSVDIYDYFIGFSFSDETGVSKPHEKAFKTSLDEIGCLPDESVHIGDIEATDIIGAKSLGMKAIRFTGDPTANLTINSSKETIADATADSWDEISQIIVSLS
jgi:putative hydrolase of the HAD superfamily